MDKIGLLLQYEGEWKVGVGEIWEYKGYKVKVATIASTASYQELVSTICSRLGIDTLSYTVILKFLYDPKIAMLPIDLNDDDSMQYFFLLSDGKSHIPRPLCVTLSPRTSPVVENEPIVNHVVPRVENFTDIGRRASFDMDDNIGFDDLSEVGKGDSRTHKDNELIDIDEDDRVDDALERNLEEFIVEENVGGCDNYPEDKRLGEEEPREECEDGEPDNGPEDMRRDGEEARVGESENVEFDNECMVEYAEMEGEFVGVSIDDESYDVGQLRVGMQFRNKIDLKNNVELVAIKNNFEFRTTKSTKSRYEIRCINEGCNWRIRAIKVKGTDRFSVRRFTEPHTCFSGVVHSGERHATSRLVGWLYKHMWENGGRRYTAIEIIEDFRREYGVKLTYFKAWKAREIALGLVMGTPEESYAKLPAYCAMLERSNPGTVTRIQTDTENRFLYFFMSLGACIKGFKGNIRPVICMDGTHLKNTYKGIMFVATCLDGNNQVFPLAFGIADSENEDACTWFLARLKEVIGEPEDLVIVSDRSIPIINAVAKVFPDAYHGACMWHLSQNIAAKFHTQVCQSDFFRAAKAYNVSVFNNYFSSIQSAHPGIAKYLEDSGFDRWARCYFPSRRYSIMTTNIAECLNGRLRYPRKLPVTALVEYIRGMLQNWFYTRRNRAYSTSSQLTKWADDLIKERAKKCAGYSIQPITANDFVVKSAQFSAIVDTGNKTCTCNQYTIDQFPCIHAIVVARERRLPSHQLASQYYWNERRILAYADGIYPVGNEEEWDVPDDVRNVVVLPPICNKRGSGRPKDNRILSRGERRRTKKCSRCGETGHYRSTCKRPLPLNSTTLPKQKRRKRIHSTS